MSRDLRPGDEAFTRFNGRKQRVTILARREGVSRSQSNIQYQTEPRLHPPDDSNPWAEEPPWIDADWLERAPQQNKLF